MNSHFIKRPATFSGPRKRRSLIAAAAMAASLSLVALAGCSNTNSASPDSGGDGEKIVIGVAMKTQQQRRWAFDVDAMQKEADKLGVKLIVQWANDDASTQSSQIENLLSQGVDALIVTPVDDKAAAASATQAKAEGVPVVSYDIGIQGVPVDYFVIRDNPQVGVLQAEAALKFAADGNYALVEGDAANDVAQAIHTAHVATLKGKSPTVVYDQFTKNWDPTTALAEAENILSSNNDDVSAFLTANDGMATSVVQALKARGLGGKVFVSGLDADAANLKLIDQGLQTMSVWTQIDEQGKIAVDVAVKLAKGEKIKPETTVDNGSDAPIPARVAPVVAVTKENLCDFVTKIAPEGWVTPEEVFADPSQCPTS
ncbi:substrate-binding domain-containing protein [Cryobacterium tagatosivorans]|uniref:sugar ABC transporter substrate-binding protein n=1 Tax=Cryobacterium tagatosivorans TaxID=1259199 RepID=UPI00141AD781|nr:substrate-binding domain-containing protein [Cryobacterium tagatosivorans]